MEVKSNNGGEVEQWRWKGTMGEKRNNGGEEEQWRKSETMEVKRNNGGEGKWRGTME